MICERKRLLWACKRPVRRTDSLHISSSPHPDNNNKNDDNDSFICIALFNKGYKVLNSNKCLKKKKKGRISTTLSDLQRIKHKTSPCTSKGKYKLNYTSHSCLNVLNKT